MRKGILIVWNENLLECSLLVFRLRHITGNPLPLGALFLGFVSIMFPKFPKLGIIIYAIPFLSWSPSSNPEGVSFQLIFRMVNTTCTWPIGLPWRGSPAIQLLFTT